jgi:hypothetical protein
MLQPLKKLQLPAKPPQILLQLLNKPDIIIS